ncbi:MAG: B12-binding domain-containing protein [Pirellulaceae bacterium]|jgi:methanogenic corrinoid protein MtbC1|nr:B12-binding domain-containing protein [Pirellulaceae bacterium]
MTALVTPKQVGRSLGVSESSVKRWCDKGEIETQYTAGGHRRIAVSTVLSMVREGKFTLVVPEALGLPATSGQTIRVVERAREKLSEALIEGDESRCRQLIFDLFTAGQRPSVICDEVVAAAFADIGDRWSCGEAEVYQERRGCEIALHIMQEMQTWLAPVGDAGMLALGGAPAGDQYALGTKMAELVLRDAQWNAVSLGDNLPFNTLEAAIAHNRPKLFWLSCSHIMDQEEFLTGYSALHEKCNAEVAFVVGGRALTTELRRKMNFSAFCDNMQHLEGFARTLHLAIQEKAS